MQRIPALLAVLCLTGLSGLAPNESAKAMDTNHGTVLLAHGIEPGWHYRRAEPPYAFYPPPRVRMRCFKNRWGDLTCPYYAWGKIDTGSCWIEFGRRVCGPDFYRVWPYYKAKPRGPIIDKRLPVRPTKKGPVVHYQPAPAYPYPVK